MEEAKLVERVMLVLDHETYDAIHPDHIKAAAKAVIAEVRKFDRKSLPRTPTSK